MFYLLEMVTTLLPRIIENIYIMICIYTGARFNQSVEIEVRLSF